jgi:serine/threonine protein kinase
MTGMGVILGTAAYMSPEQAKGRPVDKRADIWAFGVVLYEILYEMLSGQRAFEGEDVSDLLVAVLSKDVNWGALPMVWVARRVAELGIADRLVVATDAPEILAVVARAGYDAVLTSNQHATGTEIVAEVVAQKYFRSFDLVLNVQGDDWPRVWAGPSHPGGSSNLEHSSVKRGSVRRVSRS